MMPHGEEIFLALYLSGINAISFAMHAQDKLSAKGWLPFIGRVPEASLHQVELCGGSPGSFVAQRVFRHKISKTSYQRRFFEVLLAQVIMGVAWGYFKGPSWILGAAELAAAAMLAGTTRSLRNLEFWQQRNGLDSKQQWQRPVPTAPLQQQQRRNARPYTRR